MPPQIDEGLKATLDAVGESLEGTMSAVLVINLIAAVILSISLKTMWQMMNIAQVVLFLPLLAKLPKSGAYIIQFLENIVYMEFIPTSQIKSALLSVVGSWRTSEMVQ